MNEFILKIIASIILWTIGQSLCFGKENLTPVVISKSPRHDIYVQTVLCPTNLGYQDPQLIEFVRASDHKIILTLWSSQRRRTDAVWSPNGNLVCINDRVENSGDYMYIIDFSGGSPFVLKWPYDRTFDSLKRIYDGIAGTGRISVVGNCWKTNADLAITVYGGGYGDDKNYTAMIKCDRNNGAVLDEKSVNSK